MHRLLERQLRKFVDGAESCPAGLKALIHAVDEAYAAFDKDREMLERSLELSSRELLQANTELRDALHAAEAATRAKADFLATMSHEIRTPMNAVIGMTGLLLESELDADQADYVQTIRSSGDALMTIINDILDFSKISAGCLELEQVEFDLRRAANEVINMVAEGSCNERRELILVVQSDVPELVVGDPARLSQVLLNLVSNALKFTEEGVVTLRLSLADRQGERARVLLEVEDTGIGLTAEATRRLFHPFTQADSSTTRRYGGTGLGLTICKRLVEAMGGEIGVVSELGAGSRFWASIPFVVRRMSNLTRTGFRIGDLLGVRLLAADDNELNRWLIAKQLGEVGMRVDTVSGAHEALQALSVAEVSGDPYRIALLDHHMPEVDGIELAAMVREDTRWSDLPLVLFTSGTRHVARRLAVDAGLQAYLPKPIREAQLIACVLSTLGYRRDHPLEPRAPLSVEEVEHEAAPLEHRVLLAEDNPVNQKVAVLLLKRLGLAVDVANNGQEALTALETSRYALVLMDCQMPVLDGLAATAQIRQREQRLGDPPTPIIALTANTQPENQAECLEAGMDAYLSKPIRVDDLAAAMQRWLPDGGRRARAG